MTTPDRPLTSTGRRGFVTVSRSWLADDRLTDSGLRLMLWLDSHTDEYLSQLSAARIADEIGWSRNRVTRTLEALTDLGLISVHQHPRPHGGTVTVVTLHLDAWTAAPPRSTEPDDRCSTTEQRAASPRSSALLHGGAPSIANTVPEEQLLETTAPSQAMAPLPGLAAVDSAADDDLAFERFWVAYRRTGPKKVARRSWDRARRIATADEIAAGLDAWLAYWDTPGAAAIKWPQGWLSEERWRDQPPAVASARPREANSTAALRAALQNRMGR